MSLETTIGWGLILVALQLFFITRHLENIEQELAKPRQVQTQQESPSGSDSR